MPRLSLSYLDRLEAEAIDVLRDAVAQAASPVLLHSLGKESSILLQLARKAFYPGPLPFPLLHAETPWKSRELDAFLLEVAEQPDIDLRICRDRARDQEGPTAALEQALDTNVFDVAISGARRDEQRSSKDRFDPSRQRPDLWRLHNGLKHEGDSICVFPLASWTELDVWHYVYRESIPVDPLYFAKERPVIERNGTLVLVDDERMVLAHGEEPTTRKVRFRAVGCYPRSGAIESDATTLPEVIRETVLPAISGPTEIATYLDERDQKSLVRIITYGSAGDGTSTLIGSLLRGSGALLDDQPEALPPGSERRRTQRGNDASPIDVAYRYLSTPRRVFIVADTSGADTRGYEQYARNLVSGASTADCAVIVVDATNGALTRTQRHAFLAAVLGIRHAVVAVTKMDLVDFSEHVFHELASTYSAVATELGLENVVCIPVSGQRGDNTVERSDAMAWYSGQTLVEYLETVEIDPEDVQPGPFRLPVQWVSRPDATFCGFAGTVTSGVVRPGDHVGIYPSNGKSSVARIVSSGGDLDVAESGQPVMLTLADDVAVARGAMIAAVGAPPEVADQFEAMVFWMSEEPMLQGRTYVLRVGTNVVDATITPLKYKVNLETLEHVAARQLDLNELGVCAIELSKPIAFDPYTENRHTGSFILVDRLTYDTVGAGLLRFALRRSSNIQWQALEIDKRTRATAKHQRPCVLWLTGLSGAGKSTIANLVERKLQARGYHTYLLDGDNVRHGLNKDLGFADADRVENIRRVAEVAKLMVDAGLIVIVAFISPFASEREMARQLVEDGEFLEIFVDVPLALAEQRDPKGLYLKARRGELANFTGIDSPYEPPDRPELRLDTTTLAPEDAADLVIELVEQCGVLAG